MAGDLVAAKYMVKMPSPGFPYSQLPIKGNKQNRLPIQKRGYASFFNKQMMLNLAHRVTN